MLGRFRALGRAGVRPERLLDPPAGVLLPAARLPAEPRPGGGAPGRRPRGDQRRADRSANFTAFYTYLIMLIGADADARDGARDGAAGRRVGQPDVRDPRPRAADRERRRTRRRCPTGPGAVELRGVSPRATTAATPALEDVDLTVEAGTTVALVGPTGSGKTSLVALLARLYDPTRGTVAIDGADLRCGGRSLAALADRLRRRRQLPVLGHASPRTSPTRSPEATPRGDRARRAARPGARVHRAPSRRLRHADRRARADALGRAAPADRDRAGARSPTRGS